jgi:hypothetical protein
MAVKPVNEDRLLEDIHSIAASIRQLNRKLSRGYDKETIQEISELRQMIQKNISMLPPSLTRSLKKELIRENVLDQTQEGINHQDAVLREESKRIPFWARSRNLSKVAPSGKLKRTRRRPIRKGYKSNRPLPKS